MLVEVVPVAAVAARNEQKDVNLAGKSGEGARATRHTVADGVVGREVGPLRQAAAYVGRQAAVVLAAFGSLRV